MRPLHVTVSGCPARGIWSRGIRRGGFRTPGAVAALALVSLFSLITGCSDEPETLTVYTYEAFPQPIIDLTVERFAGEDGIEVSFERFSDTGGLYQRLMSERDDPVADVVVGLDTTYLSDLLEEDLLEPYHAELADLIDDTLIVDPTFHALPFDFGGVTLNYDSEEIADPPATWDDLLDPRFRDSIVLMNPSTSSPGRAFLLHTILEFGVDGYLDFWRALKPNILTITGGWFEGYGLYTEGEAPVVLSYETSPAYHVEFEGTDRYRNSFVGGEAYAQIELLGIVRGTERRKAAERMVDFLLSRTVQAEVPFNQFMYPVHPEVSIPESFADARDARVLVGLGHEEVSANLERWISDWERVMR